VFNKLVSRGEEEEEEEGEEEQDFIAEVDSEMEGEAV
jgi:hypothetical protein